MTTSAAGLYERGVELANRGRYAQAQRALASAQQAAAEARDIELLARIAGTTAYVLARLGDVDAGERLCLDALAREGLSPAAVAQLQGQLGALALERGLLDEAASWLTKSIRGLAGEPVREANMRMNRSLVDMQRGHLADAMADLERAEAAYRDAGLVAEANQAVHNRGYTWMLAGDLVTALNMMQSVREPLDEESDLWAAINELDHAEVLREAGLVTEAERTLANVSVALGRHHAPRERATADYQLARSLLSHDPVRSATVAGASARRFRRLGSHGWAVRAEAIRLRAQLAVGRIDRAGVPIRPPGRLPSRQQVEGIVDELGARGFSPEADALRMTAAIARLGREADSAIPRLRVSERTPLEVALLVYEARAARAAAHGREAQARGQAARGLRVLERTQRATGSLDLQGSSAMRGSGLITAGLISAVRSRRHDLVFEWSERARLMNQQIVAVRPPPDPAMAADLAELRVLRSAEPDGDWLASPRAVVLRHRARERQWSGTHAGELRSRASLEEVRAALAPGEALVSYVFDGRGLVALAITPARTELVDLDWRAISAALSGIRADLDVSASVTSGPMARVVRASLEGRLSALSRLLISPLDTPLADAERIILTAPGVLSALPWTMLPAIAQRPLTVASSASGWMRERQEPFARPASSAFAVGPRVARGDEEVTIAASAWASASVLQDRAASVDAVTALASRVQVLHIAAHGRHALDNPLFSGLELTDGALFGYDIDLMESVPETVVLSSCEVGRSAVRWGEEAIGMARIWLHGGARCVIAAPVVVADDVACELLGAMHEGLAAGVAPAVALAGAAERTGIVSPFQAHGVGF
ncbi:CHAT domain-containing protein [Microbacterium deminutum]|uniref:CHAT domain-containing protein n=1 Tax=Microbacterium deminutum TaxID=344164 RepID=A0ABP5BGZ5_9MICO